MQTFTKEFLRNRIFVILIKKKYNQLILLTTFGITVKFLDGFVFGYGAITFSLWPTDKFSSVRNEIFKLNDSHFSLILYSVAIFLKDTISPANTFGPDTLLSSGNIKWPGLIETKCSLVSTSKNLFFDVGNISNGIKLVSPKKNLLRGKGKKL